MEHATLPPIFTMRCVNGRWFLEAPSRQPHHRAPLRSRLAHPASVSG
jgi:hypothetical protein